MSSVLLRVLTASACTLALAAPASAQAPDTTDVPARLSLTLPGVLPAPESVAAAREGTASTKQVSTSSSGDWKFTVYPILVWVPINVGLEVDLPFDVGGGSGGGGGVGSGSSGRVDLVDTRFDGAALVGFAATNGTWRFDFDGVYAAVGGDIDLPSIQLDATLIYGHATVSRKLFGDLFVSGGVRRLATKYEARVLDRYDFESKPGIWDPLVGVGYHKVGDTLELHAIAEYGGFGVGADSDFGAAVRLDWKPWSHVGFTAGYSFFQFRFTKELGPFDFTARQHVAGPTLGLGLYF